jgi:hypothetical protein
LQQNRAGIVQGGTGGEIHAWFLEFRMIARQAQIHAVFGLAFGFSKIVYFAISMYATDPRIAALMFSILTSIAYAGTGSGLAVSELLVEPPGDRWTFLNIAARNFLAFYLLTVIVQPQKVQQHTVDCSL